MNILSLYAHVCILFLYSIVIILFGIKETLDPKTITLESVLIGLKILSFLLCTCIVYDISPALIFMYSILFLLFALYLLRRLIQFQNEKAESDYALPARTIKSTS